VYPRIARVPRSDRVERSRVALERRVRVPSAERTRLPPDRLVSDRLVVPSRLLSERLVSERLVVPSRLVMRSPLRDAVDFPIVSPAVLRDAVFFVEGYPLRTLSVTVERVRDVAYGCW
jgi:hypothetical protein